MTYTIEELPTINAKNTFAARKQLMDNYFIQLAKSAKTIKASTVRSVAASYRFNYASGKLAATRAGIKVC